MDLASQIVIECPAASFYVSDAVTQMEHADPFLAVGLPQYPQLTIVACWDEPSFTGKMRQV